MEKKPRFVGDEDDVQNKLEGQPVTTETSLIVYWKEGDLFSTDAKIHRKAFTCYGDIHQTVKKL